MAILLHVGNTESSLREYGKIGDLSGVLHGLHSYSMKRFFLVTFLVFLWVAIPGVLAQEQQEQRHAHIRLIPETTDAGPGWPLYIAIEQTLDHGWHSYWTNPGDSGEPMRIRWTLPEGFAVGPLKWPTPKKIAIGPLTSFGYEDKAILLQEIGVPWELPEGPVTLRAEIDILVCSEICIPETGSYEVTLNAPGEEQDNASVIDAAYEHLPSPYPFAVTFREEDGKLFFSFDVALRGMLSTNMKAGTEFALMPDEWGLVNNAAKAKIDVLAEQSTVVVSQERGERSLDDFREITAILGYTDFDGVPQSISFTAVRRAESGAEATPAPVAPTAKTPPPQKNTSLSTAILFALLGGLILNLMPCVFPVLSLKALKLVRMGGEERAHARLHGLLYTAGILISFAAFALALLALQAAGVGAGWGFHLQNSGFIAFLTYLFFLIGLNLAGFFEITVSIGGRDLTKEHSYAATFFSGVLAAVVATPCTAPFMGAAVGYALTQPAFTTLTVFLALGLGLALPYLMLSFIPALQRILPKPGRWMETLRRILALPMFLSAVWLGWVFMQQTGREGLIFLIGGIAALGVAVAVLKTGKKGMRLAAVLLFLAAGYSMIIKTAPVKMIVTDGWVPYTAASFAGLESGNDSLFVNMTAAWCITCKINERAALENKNVKQMFEENKVTLIKGDWTNYNAEITSYLQSFGREGVPIYVYYGPRGADGARPAPVVLPQILTPATIERTIKQ